MTSATPLTARQRPRLFEVLGKLGPLIGLALVFGLFSILRPSTFLDINNLQIILLDTAVVGTAALGATAIIISGGIDLSVGSNIALVTVVIAQMLVAGYSPIVAALTGIGAGMCCGLVIGLLVTQFRLTPFIVTLGMWGAVRGAAQLLANQTDVVPPHATWLDNFLQMLSGNQRWMIVPPGVWMLLALTLLTALVLRYTRFGRHIFAIGSNEQTARLCGVRVTRTKILIYLFATFFAGIAGILQFSRLTVGDPTTANGYELDAIAAVVIGGASLFGGEGNVFGTLVGALLMTVVANGCNKVELSNSVQQMVTGGIIVAAAAVDQLRHRRKS